MFLVVKNVLTPAEVEQIRTIARSVRFVEGRASNPHNLAKDNLQMDVSQPDAVRASNLAGAAIMRNEEIRNFVFPKRIASPLLARYEPGMKYGTHADAPFIPLPAGPLRSDVSGTIWIADPSSYEGGELTIHLGSEKVSVKGEPGSMVVYPSTTLHEVVPVSSGQRLVLITFIESAISDQVERELLWQLNEIHALEGLKMDWENRTRLQYVIAESAPPMGELNSGKEFLMDLMFKDGLLKGKRILVTGGGTGLGEVMAEAYAQLGAAVYICGRRASVLDETAKRMSDATGAAVKGIACDIRVAEAVDDMIAQIWSDGGALTGLVNNAAGNFISRTKDLSPRGFNAISDIVFRGSFYVTLACGKRWIDGGNRGNVISILTTWIWNGGPFTVPSAMSKAGLNIMTKSLATEWGPHGIRLNAIAPGPFPTKGAWERLSPQSAARDGDTGNRIPMGRNGEMPELANLAVFLMADGCDYLTGQTIAIDGAMHLSSGGNFASLSRLSDADWERIRSEIRSANEKDKAQRAV